MFCNDNMSSLTTSYYFKSKAIRWKYENI